MHQTPQWRMLYNHSSLLFIDHDEEPKGVHDAMFGVVHVVFVGLIVA